MGEVTRVGGRVPAASTPAKVETTTARHETESRKPVGGGAPREGADLIGRRPVTRPGGIDLDPPRRNPPGGIDRDPPRITRPGGIDIDPRPRPRPLPLPLPDEGFRPPRGPLPLPLPDEGFRPPRGPQAPDEGFRPPRPGNPVPQPPKDNFEDLPPDLREEYESYQRWIDSKQGPGPHTLEYREPPSGWGERQKERRLEAIENSDYPEEVKAYLRRVEGLTSPDGTTRLIHIAPPEGWEHVFGPQVEPL